MQTPSNMCCWAPESIVLDGFMGCWHMMAPGYTRIYQDNQALGCSLVIHSFSADLHQYWGQFPVRRHQEGLLFEDQPVPGQHPVEASAKTVWIGLDRSGVLSNHSQICWDPRCMLSVNSSRLAWVTWLHSFPPLFISSGNVVQISLRFSG